MLRFGAVLLVNACLMIVGAVENFNDNVPKPNQEELLRPKRGINPNQNFTTTRRSIPDGLFTIPTRTPSYYTTIKPGYYPPSSTNDNDSNVSSRLNRLETEFEEKVTKFRHELHHRNRRIEVENAATKSDVERLKMELKNMKDQQRYDRNVIDNSAFENRIEDLKTLVKVVLSNMRILNADVNSIKKNFSDLATQTELMAQSNTELLTKQFFNQGLLELHQKHYGGHSLASYQNSPKTTSENVFPQNCKQLKDENKSSGIYRIKPESAPTPFMVFCDMESRDGGWTVIQNRFDGSQEFFKNWHEYKHGFGNLGGEFWLGLNNIYYLTGNEVNELLIELEDFDGVSAYARYTAFSLGSELEGYALKVLGGYSGNAGNSLIYHAGNKFSTKDIDNDVWPEGSCALSHGGGWWYRSCDTTNLNGRYLNGRLPEQFIYQGVYWGDFGGPLYSLRKTRILVRTRDENSPPMFDINITNTTFENY
ncbi:fibroleukin-like [Onthophagus taurus]|uniref:fibroleukin-like n=1 Tax=Onthophagus taurus TaxID=166361 RepID=UPI0039BE38F0